MGEGGEGRGWGRGGGCSSLNITCKFPKHEVYGWGNGNWGLDLGVLPYIYINSCAKYVFSEHLRA